MVGQEMDGQRLEQAEFDVNDADCEVARATVRQVLQDLNGVRAVQCLGSRAVVTYNPIGVTAEEIRSAIRQIGYQALLKKPARIRVREKRKTTLGIL